MRSNHLTIGVVLLLAIFFGARGSAAEDGPTTAPASNVPAARLKVLGRGINIQGWMWPGGTTFDDTRLFHPLSDADLSLIRSLGFTHVRLCITPDTLVDLNHPTELAPKTLAAIDEAIRRLEAHHLAVAVDFHVSDKDKKEIADDDKFAEAWVTFWKTLARHLSATDPDRVFFELMNEPAPKDLRMQAEEVAAIRSVAPRHTIIATGPGWSGIGSMHLIKVIPDDNVIYAIHFYEPMTFTHQGATWAGPVLKDLKDVPYPSSPELIAPLLKLYPAGSKEAAWLKTYGDQRWDADKILDRFKVAKDWATANHVPIIMGEFGVYASKSPHDSRVRWVHDVRSAAEKLQIGWCMWEFNSGFGLMQRKKDGSFSLDTDLATALGLSLPQ